MTFLVDTQLQAGSGSAAATYVEDVFSTYLYTGTAVTQSINNGIDLSGKGGLTWIKSRSAANDNKFTDTVRGATKAIVSNTTAAQTTDTNGLTAFSSNGFSVGTDIVYNNLAESYSSWTFRKQAKFFDVVTYTGTGSATTISHNLGATPGCVMVKRTDTTGNWQVYHSGLTSAAYGIQLNLTNAQASDTTLWNSTAPTSTVFSVGTSSSTNASGGTYVAYVFASNAGGFGASGADNIITCGSYSGSAGAQSITLGYEPQWILIKRIDSAFTWVTQDVNRGMGIKLFVYLNPNNTNSENESAVIYPNATGFTFSAGGFSAWNTAGGTYIYIAIRRGPMKTPTSAASVFAPIVVASAATVNPFIQTNFPVDLDVSAYRPMNIAPNHIWFEDRLRGTTTSISATTVAPYIWSDSTAAENGSTYSGNWYDSNTGITNTQMRATYGGAGSFVEWCFRRAPGFMDIVCYTGTGSATTFAHNLGVAPELIIVKKRSAVATTGWPVGATVLGWANKMYLNSTNGSAADSTMWNSTAPTASVFSVGTNTDCNASGATFVAYLFASIPGVIKIGTYAGTGATQTIDCGFPSGARFVMIHRTDNNIGNWFVWDTARGMVSGTDPRLTWDSTTAEANSNYVYTISTGFQIVTTTSAVNASSGTYFYMAIA